MTSSTEDVGLDAYDDEDAVDFEDVEDDDFDGAEDPDESIDDFDDNPLSDLLTDEDDLVAVVAAATATGDEEDDDGIRDGEFVCQSCFMAKSESALADEEQQVCRDCV